MHYPGAVLDPDTGELISDAEVAEVEFTAFASTSTPVTARLIVRRVGSFGAVFSGLVLSKGRSVGLVRFCDITILFGQRSTIIVGLAAWRFLVGRNPSRRAFTLYLATMLIGCSLMGAAGFFGGEMLLGH